MKILIAEDNQPSGFVLAKLLEPFGECTIAENGMIAVNYFVQSIQEDALYDLVCLDILMPKMDGLQTLKTIKEVEKEMKNPDQPSAKIIMVTALGDTDNIYKAYEEGCDAYITKPYTKEKIYETLEKMEFSPAE
ncbi:MAG: response regulator [Tindallia sp. MSAO_Bac2]|nr:MAG: response regulator [Tindallia sp. MSAO_Bac2]